MSAQRVLFVCVENSNRSQMAEAFARLHGGDTLEAFSAGSKPSGKVNPKAIAAMAARGYDMSGHSSTGMDALPHERFDAVITMGCGDACPQVGARIVEDWPVPDPRDLEGAAFHAVRDEIEERVLALVQRLA